MTTDIIHPNKKPVEAHHFIEMVTTLCIGAQNNGLCSSFVEFSGHVQQLSVRLFAPVWKQDELPTYSDRIYLDADHYNPDHAEMFIDDLKKYIEHL